MILNEGLEVLGSDQESQCDKENQGVFEKSAVEEVSLSSTIEAVTRNTFKDCKNLRKINFSEGLKRIESYCFAGSGVEEIVFPESLADISDNAFEGCTNLRSIAFGENSKLRSIGKNAFNNTSLETFIAPASLGRIYEELLT